MCRPARHLAVLAGALVLASPRLPAWNDAGHRIVALVTWGRLTAGQRQRLAGLLRKHPRFESDFLGRMPSAIRGASRATQDRWVFAHAATWPDLVRRFVGGLRRKYHRGAWHYVNEPLFSTARDASVLSGGIPANRSRVWRRSMYEPALNIVQALQRCRSVYRSATASDGERAIALCWLMHLVGDLHQPLHATALFSQGRFPRGDRGGNDIPVAGHFNLHSFWDGCLGSERSLATLARTAARLAARADLQSAGNRAARVMGFGDWVEESYDAAWEHVYSAAILAEVDDKEGRPDVALEAVQLSARYVRTATGVARRRVVAAGFRLAKVITE